MCDNDCSRGIGILGLNTADKGFNKGVRTLPELLQGLAVSSGQVGRLVGWVQSHIREVWLELRNGVWAGMQAGAWCCL